MKVLALTSLLFSAGILSSCASAHSPALMGAAAYPIDSTTYEEVLKTYSNTQKVYRDYETRLILKGTLLSPEFKTAYANEIARRQVLPAAERQSLVTEMRGEVSEGVWFLFTISAPNQGSLDLDKNNTDWRVRLYDKQGNSANSLALEKLRFENPLEPNQLYPYITRWDETYIAQFPANAEGSSQGFFAQGGELTLQIAGPVAAGEMLFPAGP